ncbi:hypothetical protein KDA_61300 [Dictyobacter alpinus]|uniref:non-specific serine/threonine protein kinase n=1 Tax=Dictyobacter alpinus TaxID=2014873 RepID=A0A402BH22_9CHLR|nr:protein kinase [Dictyobacter alpinus]GCE30646.1 hypothetical protein KDA_61300 [Dictyobacter alpinus]
MLLPVEDLVGQKIGDYHLKQLIGQGTLSAVYIAQGQGGEQQVMLTVFILPSDCKGAARERFMTRFMRQAGALRQLQHPYIVPTYDFGEALGYPYLVTPLIEGETVASFLKRKERCSPELMLALLRQIAEALDYAHNNDVIHGTLKSSNILLVRQGGPDGLYSVMVAGFGLAHMLEMNGIGQVAHQYPSLFSIAGTLLTNPIYIAPEVVLGGAFDARADVYALGILVFEMLCGHPPFTSTDPFELVQKHVEERIPSLQVVAPEISPALDIALQRALERDPALRLQSAGKLVSAFERVMNVMEEAARPPVQTPGTPLPMKIHLTLVNTLPPDDSSENVVAMPGITSSHIHKVSSSFPGNTLQLQSIPRAQSLPLGANTQAPASTIVIPEKGQSGPFPSTAWARESSPVQIIKPEPDLAAGTTSKQAALPKEQQPSSRPDMGRRRVVMAVNGTITAAVLAGGGFSLLKLVQNGTIQLPGIANASKPTNNPTAETAPVISRNKPAKNAALNFTDPLTHKESILLHLPDDKLVAYDRACTHEGVLVTYDPKTGKLVCPRHHAQFDPQRAGAVVKGPAQRPLKPIAIHVNGDGSITRGAS